MLLPWNYLIWLAPFLRFCCGEDHLRSFPLGLSNGFVKSEQLSASSSANDANFSPSHARLNAFSPWCGGYTGPGQWPKEWLQVDFRQQVTLMGVALRGSRLLQEKDHHVTSFYLLYSDSATSSSFRVLEDKLGRPHVFPGVSNFNDPVFHWLPITISTRFVRFKAKSLKNGDKETAKVCVGLEFFGQMKADVGCRSTYALGMENGGITNLQLSASSSKFYTTTATKARLNRAGKLAWCAASTTASEWLQIDLAFPVVITGFIVQGDGHGDCISKYIIYVGNSTSTFQEIRSPDGSLKNFDGNSGETSRDPVLTLLESPVVARYVRFSPQALGKHSQEFCMRAEVLGYHPDGPDQLLLYDQAMFWEGYSNAVTRMLYTTPIINAGNAYCLNSALGPKPFLQIELTKPYVIAGLSIQGAMTSRSWVTGFQLWYGTEGKLMALFNKTFTGNKDQIAVVHHWFFKTLITNLVRVVALTWEMSPCFRVQLHGVYDGSKLKVESGSDISLQCPSRSCPQLLTTWYRNNVVLDKYKGNLQISTVTREDDGLYYCVASDDKRLQTSPIFYLQVLPDGDCSRKSYPCKPGFECVLKNSTYTCQCKMESQTNFCSAMQTKETNESNNWKLILIGGALTGFLLVAILITLVILYCKRSGRFSPYDRNAAGQRRSKDITDGKYTERECLTNVENNTPQA